MSYVTVKPGDLVPEAASWSNLSSWIRQKKVKWDAHQECYVALKQQKIKRAVEVLVVETPVKKPIEPVVIEALEVKKEEPVVETPVVVKEENKVEAPVEIEPPKPKRRGRPRKKKVR